MHAVKCGLYISIYLLFYFSVVRTAIAECSSIEKFISSCPTQNSACILFIIFFFFLPKNDDFIYFFAVRFCILTHFAHTQQPDNQKKRKKAITADIFSFWCWTTPSAILLKCRYDVLERSKKEEWKMWWRRKKVGMMRVWEKVVQWWNCGVKCMRHVCEDATAIQILTRFFIYKWTGCIFYKNEFKI